MNASALLTLVAVVVFVLAVFSVSFGVPMVPLGLAFYAAGRLV